MIQLIKIVQLNFLPYLKIDLVEVFHFPTTFKVEFENGEHEIYKTHEVELLEDNKENE